MSVNCNATFVVLLDLVTELMGLRAWDHLALTPFNLALLPSVKIAFRSRFAAWKPLMYGSRGHLDASVFEESGPGAIPMNCNIQIVFILDRTTPSRLAGLKTDVLLNTVFLQDRRGYYKCLVCPEHQYEPLSKAASHEYASRHTRRLREHDRPDQFASTGSTGSPQTEAVKLFVAAGIPNQADQSLEHEEGALDPLATSSYDRDEGMPPDDIVPEVQSHPLNLYDPHTVHGPALLEDDPAQLYDNWGGVAAVTVEIESDVSETEGSSDNSGDDSGEEAIWEKRPPRTSQSTRLSNSGNWNQKRAFSHEDVTGDDDLDCAIVVPASLTTNDAGQSCETESRHTTLSTEDESEQWWPWPDQATCLLDCTGAFPRSLFSENEMRGVRWVARRSGSRSIASVRQVKKAREKVVAVAGTAPKHHNGLCGHIYATADLATIIRHVRIICGRSWRSKVRLLTTKVSSQEFANPLVRSKLEFYPEFAENELQHPRQAKKWCEEIDPNLAAPMARNAEGKDFFVHELALASIDGLGHVAPVVPTRWFYRNGQLVSKAQRAMVEPVGPGGSQKFVIDGRTEELLEVPLTAYLLNVEDLLEELVQRRWALPPPDLVHGVMVNSDTHTPLAAWTHPVRNAWRIRAAGKRVYSLPLWVYCDDTSGNTSKKWNKHNSVLFTLSGLPGDMSQLLYNIHFLSTSNLASPLEMMEQISSALQEATTNGLTAWDCVHNEDVLAIPWVLAFQGDNPMASEFASHIGMKGKLPCRVCHARVDDGGRSAGIAGEKERIREYMTVSNVASRICDVQGTHWK
ncbi:hypothetical protein NUW54_g8391 [Trametes sanguinea]|uniref:Uncharacterized protein n=1 Tax=Trametes sanguinea TaxID=158606 RepID=A0ACC1PDQ9_9APHY|nr:hypothetical protein NUW54_g8391 [Trametes sanguinea]